MAKVLSLQTSPPPQTVAAAVEEFLSRNWSPNTRRSYRSDLRSFARAFGDRSVTSVSGTDIQAHLDARQNRAGGPLMPASYNRHHAAIRSLFSWLVKQEELDRSPMERVERKRLPERLPKPMTEEQLQQFFYHVKTLRDRALFSLLYGSGIRVSEALALNIERVKLADGSFTIMGKGSVERVGYLSEATMKLLRRYLRERGRLQQGPLFVSRQGRLSYAMVYRLFQKYAEGLPGEKPTIHSLRHSFGSERAGTIDALILRDLMGHKNLRTTQQYAKVNPDATKKAFQQFDQERMVKR